MKQYVKSAAFAMALIFASLVQPAMAEGGPYVKFASINVAESTENNFSIALVKKENTDVVYLNIENYSRKSLAVYLLDPAGDILDVFVTSRKFVKMSKAYNFSGAEEGLYSIIIKGGAQPIKKQVKIEQVTVNPVLRLSIQ